MRILADENFPRIAVEMLRSRGHDVNWVCDVLRGYSDVALLDIAQRENRVIATFDKDFGELAFRHGLPASCGVVLFRLTPFLPQRLASIIVSALESRQNWDGLFSVVEDMCIRSTPLPRKPR